MSLRSVVLSAIASPFLVGLVLAGCGSDDPPVASNPSLQAGPSIDELPAKLAEVVCGVAARCLGPSLPLFLRGEDCVTLNTRTIADGDIGASKRLVAEGKLVYDATKVQGCLDAYKAGGCAQLENRAPDACHAVFSGKVAPGSPCGAGPECEQGSFCQAGAGCPGTCATRKAAGLACVSDDACVDGLACVRGVCAARVGDGAACSDSGAACKSELLCIEKNDAKVGVCRSPTTVFVATNGTACDLSKGPYCAIGSVCQLDTISGSGATFVCTPPVASGAKCKVAVPDACPESEYCAVDFNAKPPILEATCTKRPTAGESCALSSARCAPYQVCEKGVCREKQRLGGACESAQGCYSKICKGGVCAEGLACEPGTN